MQLLSLRLLWAGLLLLRVSSQPRGDFRRTRKLCGRHLMNEIVKLCGSTDWSQFHFEAETHLAELISQVSEKVEAISPDLFKSHQTAFPAWGRFTNPASTSASEEEEINSLDSQSLPEYQFKEVNGLPEKTEFSSSRDINPYVHENINFQKKNTNKIKTLHSLFWGKHPQRKRRGYSDKCCHKGCSKIELAIACLPYINF